MEKKEFVIEDGQMYYPKKPLYRQPLFWTTIIGAVMTFVLAVTCFLLFIGLSLGTTSVDDYSTYDASYDYVEYQVGEGSVFYDGLSMTVKSMGIDDQVELVDTYYSHAYVVELELENTTSEDVFFDEYYCSLIDPTTEIPFTLDLRTYDVNLLEKLKPGEKMTVKLIYGVEDETNFAFIYEDAMWSELITQGL
ncbi:TPA: DUF4352 domain-containing protein [Streptococcus suis]|uniref:DUF4352 domain-containing protein n=1 Tax=Streptococcus suis TaxID=1307 RepID=UPI000CF58623|nr:DUF4352 domain-containing protein [Streptococcus suis]NQJ72154.1 DUF4352 domain-containing protein [Streptococcus suis]NRG69832.1 DUF4352 domain-containing protein [Streptococcus suis]HEL9636485.1 DUF4352 domain-containing protein [Streptococcus suis]HEM5089907.1 DUF4352 domain-containing protein [Streptococcus suis]HEM5097615.1 DUF4352 domain-containing protein [Streptococcus suis]